MRIPRPKGIGSAAAMAYAALAAAVIWSPGANAQIPPAVPRFERGDSVVVRGVEIFDRIVYLPVSIKGLGAFTFVLDTGDGQLTALDRGEADSIGLRSTNIGDGGGAGEETVQFSISDSTVVSMAGLSFAGRPLLTFPVRRMDAQWGKRKDGLIGGDLLSAMVTVIDYEGGRVVFHDGAYEYGGRGERIPVEIVPNFIFVHAQVLTYGTEKPLDALFLLDTGVRLSVFNSPFAKKHDLAAQSPASLAGVTGFGIGGLSKGVVGRVRELRIGSFLLSDPVVSFSTDTTGALADTSFAGIIGADILSRFTLVLDYRRSQIFLEKNGDFDAPFEYDMCGIRFVWEGARLDHPRVSYVFDGSPAARAGLRAGDLVTSIDGREAGSFDQDELREYLRREGAVVRFTIDRGSGPVSLSVRLKRMV